MAYLAIVNSQTGLVENIVVPPEGPNVMFVGAGYDAFPTDTAKIGDTYLNGEFLSPVIDQVATPEAAIPA